MHSVFWNKHHYRHMQKHFHLQNLQSKLPYLTRACTMHPILVGQIQEKKELHLRHVRRRAIFLTKILEKKCILYAVKYSLNTLHHCYYH